jgi:hypothetical protein
MTTLVWMHRTHPRHISIVISAQAEIQAAEKPGWVVAVDGFPPSWE